MDEKKIDNIISQMTLEEKAGMCSGKDNWYLKGVERLGIPSVMVSDGPHGLRTQRNKTDHLGLNESIPAVCFPAACATAASFDRNLLAQLGKTLGRECLAEEVSVLLGPAMNIKRSPLCGRNFEYFSEDPYLTGELASAYVEGVQSEGVGVSLKHFAANNQETRRQTVSANIDERTLREIYLSAFETVVKKAKPQTVMCSYNRLNGEQVSHSKKLLDDVLRREWGFDGYVMSDWGAVVNRVKGLQAGLDLEMPYSGGHTDKQIIDAVKSGELDEETLDKSVKRILKIVLNYAENKQPKEKLSLEADHEKAVNAAKKCIVLLKNEGDILPLKSEEKVAFIGEFASSPRFQGGGSSHINSFCTTSALQAAKANGNVAYSQGYDLKDGSKDEALITEAALAAKKADKAVLFVGLPDSFESEGYDREHMDLPLSHIRLIEAVTKAQPNVVVVLHNGSPVAMPWLGKVKGLLEVYLGGQGVGEATVDVLFGKFNPSARLPESFPKKLEDNPSYLNFPGQGNDCDYAEGLFVGYRYYDKKKMEVLFPFGYGLSYTKFKYGAVAVDKDEIKDGELLTVKVDVTNVGSLEGEEVVQLYISDKTNGALRPNKELKGFEKLSLKPGQTRTAEFCLDRRAFAYYNADLKDWTVTGGEYEVIIAKNANEAIKTKQIKIEAKQLKFTVTGETTMGELLQHDFTKPFVIDRIKKAGEKFGGGSGGELLGIKVENNTIRKLVEQMPLRGIKSFMGISDAELDEIIRKFNEGIQNY